MKEGKTYNLCFPTSLHNSFPLGVPAYSPNIVCSTTGQASECQQPEDDAKWQGESELERRGFVFEMERDYDGHGDNGHVD